MGGLEATTLKKLKGAPFNTPCVDLVVTKAMGLGIILPVSNL